ncbi:hypothetical protein LX92_00502 [Maribacter polysiphoniae]|uniref:Disease resistance R13L4/SHOC-2-like LRR domain-containing protein n=2 Tax=Maribacter polysiphoniae TaxID=429344 RepID=A0A316E8S0_9FLAO|nr:hypothetical protein LX92_00502 [Maribacter polysiphoniae]
MLLQHLCWFLQQFAVYIRLIPTSFPILEPCRSEIVVKRLRVELKSNSRKHMIAKQIFCPFIFILFSLSMYAKVPQSEKEVLLALYNNTQGENWTTSWSLNKPVSKWYGVQVEDDHVVGIDLFNNNLVGQLPNSISKLEKLRELNLAFNRLNGEIPEGITSLKHLKVLRMGKNSLTGSIPENIGNLQSLEILELLDNDLSGELPSSIGKLVNIKSIVLSSNELEGEIPDSIGSLTQLEALELGDNKIKGEIPENMGKLLNLNRLVLLENQLIGFVPNNILSLPKLRLLQLQNNNLGMDMAFQKSGNEANYAIFDVGQKILHFDQKPIPKFEFKADTRMADTKFEDED